MESHSDIILNHKQITHKFTRLAWQIYENNMDESVIWIAGIDRRGMYIANRIAEELKKISGQEIRSFNISINRETLSPEYHSEFDLDDMKNGVLILIDDVLNTGITMLLAMVPLVSKQIRKIQVMVLAARSHRMFPVKADFVGIKMATTLQEHLNFDNSNEGDLKLVLN